jgi:hypothetical protein
MKINRNNFEAYLIDYIEGNLNKQDEEIVNRFLEVNPDIADEFKSLRQSEATLEKVKDTLNKAVLYKSFSDITSITKENYEDFCIACHEGDLDDSSKQRLFDFIDKHPELKPLFDLHAKIHLQADNALHFPGKRELKKVQVISVRRIIYTISAGVAAAAAIVFLWLTLPNTQKAIPGKNTDMSQINVPATIHLPTQAEEIPEARKVKVVQGKLQNEIQPEYKQLATVDTTDTRQLDKIIIAELQPRAISLENEFPLNAPQFSGNQIEIVQPDNIARNELSKTTNNENLPENKIWQRKLIYNALNIGVKGFNTLTESQLALQTSQDDKGRLTSIAIDADNFEFIRKTQRNNQN